MKRKKICLCNFFLIFYSFKNCYTQYKIVKKIDPPGNRGIAIETKTNDAHPMMGEIYYEFYFLRISRTLRSIKPV